MSYPPGSTSQLNRHALVSELSVGEQQRVEILKTLYHDVSLLILDEPTAVLTPQESNALFDVLRTLAANGKTIILITHKLREVETIADRVSVLRGGKLVGTVDAKHTSTQELVRMMVGREVYPIKRQEAITADEVALEVENIRAFNSRGIMALKDISFKIHRGEIVGIAGVSGNGQLELANLLAGLLPINQGKILLDGKDVTGYRGFNMIREGVSYIPGDRIHVGSIPDFSIKANMIIKSFWLPPITRNGLIDQLEVERRAEIGRLRIFIFAPLAPSFW